MAETQKPKMKWYSPQVLADRANDGFLFAVRSTEKAICSIQSSTGKGLLSIARSTGKAAHFIESGTVNGVSKVGQVLFRRKKEMIKQQTEPVTEDEASQDEVSQEAAEEISEKEDTPEGAVASEPQMTAPSQDEQQTEPVRGESLLQDASPEVAADAQQENAPSPADGQAAEPAESTPALVTEDEASQDEVSQTAAEEISEKEDAPEGAVAGEPQMTAPSQNEQQTEPVKEESLLQDASPEVAAAATQEDAPFPANGEATEPAESTPEPVTEEEPLRDEGMKQELPLDLEALLKQHSPRDKVEAIRLRQALDDLLHGSEAARLSALKTLIGLRQVAEPFLIASLQIASPQMAEVALEGLSQIGSPQLIGYISDVLASPDPELRIVALRAAQRLTDDEARPFLERGLGDASARVKRRVLSYLSWRDSSWALAEIRRLCDDPEPDVKWAALEALLAVRPSEAYDNLELMMSSLDPAHRHRAVALLEQQKSLLNREGDAPSPADGQAAEPAESTPALVTEDEPSQDEVSQAAAEEISDKEDTPEVVVAGEPQMTAPSQDEQQTEPVKEESLLQDASPEVATDAQQGDAPSLANGEATEPAESEPDLVTEEKPLWMRRWSKRGRNILH